jgi:hypothetical protein
MENGNGNGNSVAKRMWSAATTDVVAGREVDRLVFCVGYLAGELDKRDVAIEELRAEIRRMKEGCDDGK